jgi:hypothetical protein
LRSDALHISGSKRELTLIRQFAWLEVDAPDRPVPDLDMAVLSAGEDQVADCAVKGADGGIGL